MTAAIFATRSGAQVLLIDAAPELGGTFHLSTGQMSAAGTRVQAARGIIDTPDLHYADVMRISRGTANAVLVRLAVDNAADTLHWLLDLGLELEPGHPIIHDGHEPYQIPRTYWAAQGGLAILNILRPEVERCAARGNLTIRPSTRLLALAAGRGGPVTGLTVEREGSRETILAGNTLLCSGGFSGSPEMFEQNSHGYKHFGGGYRHGTGGGFSAAQAVGASSSGGEHFLPTFAGVADASAPGGITFATETNPRRRLPCEIYVDLEGRRFMREDEPSVDTRERILRDLRNMTFWAIFDARIARERPGFILAEPDVIAARFASNEAYRQADTLAALAAEIGVDAGNLTATVAAFNTALQSAEPDPAGRIHRPLPILEAPFYAVRHVGWSILSFAGLDIDRDFNVLDSAHRPIGRLYAAGEIIGFAKTSGNAFCGGMSVTPAMTFGRLAGGALGTAAVRHRMGCQTSRFGHDDHAGNTGEMAGSPR